MVKWQKLVLGQTHFGVDEEHLHFRYSFLVHVSGFLFVPADALRLVGFYSLIAGVYILLGLLVTASIGVAVSQSDTPDLSTLQRQADQAMYQAKALGRNRVSLI